MDRRETSIMENVLWGLGWSARFVVAYSIIAGAIYLIAGPSQRQPTLGQILLMYITLGAISGMLVGLLRPFFRKRVGATFCGMIVGSAVYLGGGIMLAGFEVLHQVGPVVALMIPAVAGGGYLGSKWWRQTQQENAEWTL